MRKQSLSIQELLLHIGNNDIAAYEELYYAFYQRLYSFALSLIQSKQQAEEIVSDVFIKVWQSRKHLPEVDNISVYLYASVRNRTIDYLNKDRKYNVVRFSRDDWEEVLIELKDPSDYCISSDLMKKINAAINRLPPQCKIIFKLIKEDGLSYKQVAEIMELSPFTVRNQLAIAVRKMGEILPEYIHESLMDSKK
jgi:RNA polymerase sigma-70 factor (ECF subfamily)